MEGYERTGVLGQGTYGKVYKATNTETGQVVALKKTLLTNEEEGVPPTTLREVSILRSLASPYVVKLEEVVHTEEVDGKPLLYLVFEYLDHDLKQFQAATVGKHRPLNYKLAKNFCYQILLGLKYCHASAVMHRDIKPQNLLVDKEAAIIKLADFGLGRVFSLPVEKYTHEVVTLWYRAPEILLGTRCYSTGVDTWSVGCVFAEMLTGKALFQGESEIEQLMSVFRVLGTPTEATWAGVGQLRDFHEFPQWKPVPLVTANPGLAVAEAEGGLDLLQGLLQLDPSKRLSAVAALRHPYFDDIRESYLASPAGTNADNMPARTAAQARR